MSKTEILAELERLTPAERAEVQAKLDELAEASSIASHPAIGMWSDRTDLPDDPVEASKELRRQMMGPRFAGRGDE